MLPDGWSTLTLGEIFSFKNGLNGEKDRYGSGTKFVNVMDVFRGPRLKREDIVGEMEVTARQLSEYGLKYGDVLFNRTSETDDEIALSTIYLDEASAVFGGFVIRARPTGGRLSAEFSVYGFQSTYMRRAMIRLGQGAIRSNIGQGDLSTVPMILPPLPEQQRIAEILSTWDRAIETVEKLIANARAQKKALMQHLLTGKKRLPGFSGEWKNTTLGKRGTFRKGAGISRAQVQENGIPCVRYGEIYTHHNDIIRSFNSFIHESTAGESQPIDQGDILFTCSGETAEEIGKCVAFIDDHIAYAGGDIVIFSPDRDSATFLAYLLNSTPLAAQKAQMGQGNSVVHISAANIAKLHFRIPELNEQEAIARLLVDTDTVILSLTKQANSLCQEKSALMQQLLTGKRRVQLRSIAS